MRSIHALLVPLLLSLTLGCVGKDASEDEDGDEDGASWEGGPADIPPRAGCTETLEGDVGMDGSVDINRLVVYSEHMDEDGSSPLVRLEYSDHEGEYEDIVQEVDADGCRVSAEIHSDLDGVTRDERWTATCDDQLGRNFKEVEVEVDGSWEFESRETNDYTYDDQDRVIEELRELESADAAPYSLALTWTWDGETPGYLDVVLDEGDGPVGYYAIEYDASGGSVVEARIILGEYFGDADGDLYSTTTYAYDGAGNLVERVQTPVDGAVEAEAWGYDEHDRATHYLLDDRDGDEPAHEQRDIIYDPELRRYVSYANTDHLDAAGDFVNIYTYEGSWPWDTQVVRTFPNAPEDDTSYEITMDCASSGGVSLLRPDLGGAARPTLEPLPGGPGTTTGVAADGRLLLPPPWR
jgi:hypothetical protein